MTATALQLDLLDREPTRRPPLRIADAESTAAAALALAQRTPSGSHPGPAGGRLTLDDMLVGVWEGLLARRTVRCPVCRTEAMAPADADAPSGRCDACRAQLT
jgi:hypothetical protein